MPGWLWRVKGGPPIARGVTVAGRRRDIGQLTPSLKRLATLELQASTSRHC